MIVFQLQSRSWNHPWPWSVLTLTPLLRSQHVYEWQCYFLWRMPPDSPQLRLVRTGGTAYLLHYLHLHCTVWWNNNCWPLVSRHFNPLSFFQALQQTLMWGLFLSILQDFGRGRGLTSRCDFIQNLQRRGCGAQFIEYPTSSISVLKNMPLSSTGSGLAQFDVVQIMPQKISLSLRPGESSPLHT